MSGVGNFPKLAVRGIATASQSQDESAFRVRRVHDHSQGIKTMHRRSRLAFCIVLSLAALSGQARAQWGYGYYPYGYGGYGWDGWGGTAQGDIARGLAYFNMGAGIYNVDTALARSINLDTVIRWNQYVYLSQQEATREYFARRNAPIAAKSIREIPFRNASEGLTFSLSQLKASSQWPAVLLEPRFASERAEFETLVEEIRKENTENGQISPGTLSKLRGVTSRLKDKLAAMPLEDTADNQEALKFVKTVTALARLLEKPEIDEVLNELKKIEKTTVGNLLAFMHTFNLRFAPATTPRQRMVYNELYPILAQMRDRIISEAKLDNNVTDMAGKAKLHDFFSAMDLDHIEGKKKVPTPPPPSQP